MPPSKPISACWRWPGNSGTGTRRRRPCTRSVLASICAHEFEKALEFSHQAQALAAEIGNQNILAASLFVIAFVHAVTGKLDEATHGIEEALRVSREAGEKGREGFNLTPARTTL